MASRKSFSPPLKAVNNQNFPPKNIPSSHQPDLPQPYYLLVLQNPKNMTSQYGPSFPKSKHSFTVHGVWPKQVLQMEPYHTENTFTKSQLKTANLLKDLNEYWPSLHPKFSNFEFWQKEFEKHGKLTKLSAQEFFGNSIKKAKYYIDKFSESRRLNMAKNGFKLEELNAILKSVVGKEVEIRLLKRPRGGYILPEIRIYLNLEWETIDCPNPHRSNRCGPIQNGKSAMIYFEA